MNSSGTRFDCGCDILLAVLNFRHCLNGICFMKTNHHTFHSQMSLADHQTWLAPLCVTFCAQSIQLWTLHWSKKANIKWCTWRITCSCGLVMTLVFYVFSDLAQIASQDDEKKQRRINRLWNRPNVVFFKSLRWRVPQRSHRKSADKPPHHLTATPIQLLFSIVRQLKVN